MIGHELAAVVPTPLFRSDRPDIVAATRFILLTKERGVITTIDAYLLTNGQVELWEDDGYPGVDEGGEYSGHPHDDWTERLKDVLTQMMVGNYPTMLENTVQFLREATAIGWVTD